MNIEKKYNRDDFLAFLKSFVPGFTRDVRSVGTSGLQSIKEVSYLGESAELELAIFELTHLSSSDARVALAMDGFRVMKGSATYRALVIYCSGKGEDWRLSLMTASPVVNEKGKVGQSFSNPRRFSFFLGPNAKINTPYQFLIKQGAVKDFTDLQKRFSLEVVNKDFYNKIQEAYYKLVGGKLGKGKKAVTYKTLIYLPSQPDHSQVCLDFVVRLIGRIIFCWFLREKKSPKGIALMPKELLSLRAIATHPDYYHKILEPIFFEVLNKPLKSRGELYSNEFFSLIPYLNGGLFSPHEDDYYKLHYGKQSIYHNTLIIPDEWFTDLFKTLETYNFTIDENTSFDEELSIDPEMLGRIFENLLAEINPETGESARNCTGSYYTPRSIVDYMVDESLLLYLKQQTQITEGKLGAIVSYDLGDDSKYPLNEDEKQKIIDALEKLKLLDPACGSGAFPIGALQKIVFILQQVDPDGQLWFKKQLEKASPEFRKDIQKRFSNQELDFLRKLGIVKECIFGVDIQPIAIEISRLRCFLTLIVDEHIDDQEDNRGIKPLPNLDFKFVAANSLISPPDENNQSKDSFIFNDFQNELELTVSEYFGADDADMKSRAVNKLHELIDKKVGEKRNAVLRDMGLLSDEKFEKAYRAGKKKNHGILLKEADMWSSYKNIFMNKKVDFFHPKYFFPSVRDGFDIVIANPPYVRQEKFTEIKEDLKKEYGEFFDGRADLYTFFIKLGFNLAKKNGIFAYITSNKFFVRGYGKNTRSLLTKGVSLKKVVNFGELPVFQASVDSAILIAKNTKPKDVEFLDFAQAKSDADIRNILQFFEANKGTIKLITLGEGEWSLQDSAKLAVLHKVKNQPTSFGQYYSDKIFAGLKSGLDSVYVITRSFRDKLVYTDKKYESVIKPWLRGKDVKKWEPNFHGLWVINLRSSSNFKWPWSGMSKVEAEKVFQLEFPLLYKHLILHKEKISKRSDQGNYWWELRPCAYDEKFNTRKIIYPDCAKEMRATYDDTGLYGTLAMYIVSYDPIIMGILNSKLFDWYARMTFATFGDPWNGGRIIFKTIYMSKVPIPDINNNTGTLIKERVDKIIAITKSIDYLENLAKKKEVKEYEKQIDQMVYKLYALTPEEIEIVENSYILKKDSGKSFSGENSRRFR